MAAHRIGKLKFKISKNGIQYIWGDGEKKTLFKSNKRAEDVNYVHYQGDDSDYAYEDEGAYYDQPESEQPYDEDLYYDDERPEDEGGVYYNGEEEPQAGPVMEYIENNQWVLFALLVILPPVGIYLLWRFNRYDIKIRSAVSVVSAIWFIVALILIFSGIFNGGEDTSTDPIMSLTSLKPTVTPTAAPTATPTATATAQPDDLAGTTAAPSPTPLTGGTSNATGTASSGNVYSPQTGLYYHNSENCTKIDSNVSVTLVTVEAARNRNQYACPLCSGGTVYYATSGGSRYHTDRTCDGMKDAVEYSKDAAEAEGKVACWVCAGGKKPTTSGDTSDSSDTASTLKKYAASITNDRSGLKVWMTSGGQAYHATANCRGMSGASQVTLLKALQSGKPACSECLSYLNSYVYCTSGGTYYHSASTTCGMKSGTRVTLSAALVLGKKKCPDCIDESLYTNKTQEESSSNTVSGEIMVYATANGDYYHTNSTCGGMKNASRVTLKAALKAGRPACPVCCPSAEKTVYASSNSKNYHSYAGCSDMSNPSSGTLAQALTYNLTACPRCWSGDGEAVKDSDASTDDGNANAAYSGIFVYATETGSRYHASKSCSAAEEDMVKVLLEQAIDDGKKACSTCAGYADDKVYGVSSNKYFHKTSNCSGITGAKSGTVVDALLVGLKACPICYADETLPEETTQTVNKFKGGTSGVDVYATYEGRYYHINRLCSGISGTPVEVTLETALNNDKSACPVCTSSAARTVYGTTDGKYYHYSASCAGDSATKANLDVALAYGFKACPNCVTKADSAEKLPSEYTEGTSGIKVYAIATDDEYHTRSDCGGMENAQYVTLEKVLNLGYAACNECAAVAGREVYAYEGSALYHYSADCQGKGYVSGALDSALAYGLDACPVCVAGDDANTDADVDTDLGELIGGDVSGEGDLIASANTTVYVDLSGNSNEFIYHADDKCSDTGMSGGIGVTLEYALDHGYSRCEHCKPAAAIQ